MLWFDIEIFKVLSDPLIGVLHPKAAFFFLFYFFIFKFNQALINRSGPMVRHRNFQSVIVPLTRESAFYSIFTFNFTFNRALISHSGAVVRHRKFQSVIGS